jgi:hypothetical protein
VKTRLMSFREAADLTLEGDAHDGRQDNKVSVAEWNINAAAMRQFEPHMYSLKAAFSRFASALPGKRSWEEAASVNASLDLDGLLALARLVWPERLEEADWADLWRRERRGSGLLQRIFFPHFLNILCAAANRAFSDGEFDDLDAGHERLRIMLEAMEQVGVVK